MAKKRPPFNANSAIRGSIRRVFARSPVVIEVRNAGRREVPKFNKDGSRSKKDAVQFSCQICNEWVGSTKIAVDHIDPVISTETGFVDWNTFIDRIGFDKPENLQRVCDTCHQTKTNAERFERNLKKDTETISALEDEIKRKGNPKKVIGKSLAKFSKKKLAEYPAELADRIEKLKALAKKG
jgi:hypothetical protein